MFIAGEASADAHAADVIENLRKISPDTHIFGAGGPKMQAAGMELLVDLTQHAVVGLVEVLKNHVVKKIGAIARPDDIFFTAELPKTRSGKIMRRLLRDIAEGRAMGDTTTLADPTVVASLKQQYEEGE